jgi:pyridoxal phosphate enzyme (YggS family)
VSTDLNANLADIRLRIGRSASRAGRDHEEIKLVAVSKTHPTATLRDAMSAGLGIFGENKVQEAETKIGEIGRDAAEWHLIGRLQSNKARRAVQLFDVIQSVDSLELAQRLERICLEEGRAGLSVFAQVDLAGEATKSGVAESDLTELADYLSGCKGLRFDGLMLLPPFFDEAEAARPYFRRLRELRDELAAKNAFADRRGDLSMGMSHDFEFAIEEGATLVRVGTAIFGERAYGNAH